MFSGRETLNKYIMFSNSKRIAWIIANFNIDQNNGDSDCFHDGAAPGLTGDGGVQGEGLQAAQLLAAGLLHAVTEDVLPGVELQQLDAAQQLVGLLQTLAGVVLGGKSRTEGQAPRWRRAITSKSISLLSLDDNMEHATHYCCNVRHILKCTAMDLSHRSRLKVVLEGGRERTTDCWTHSGVAESLTCPLVYTRPFRGWGCDYYGVNPLVETSGWNPLYLIFWGWELKGSSALLYGH